MSLGVKVLKFIDYNTQNVYDIHCSFKHLYWTSDLNHCFYLTKTSILVLEVSSFLSYFNLQILQQAIWLKHSDCGTKGLT